MDGKTLERLLLILIAAAYLLVGGLFAISTPDWQVPDEPAHYNYVAQVANNGCCPTIQPGDWDSPYLERLKSAHFKPALLENLASIQYEDHQPPLYYLLAAVVYNLTSGSLTALRLFSVLLGLGVVLSAYATGKVMLPDRPQIALGAAALVAFLPQHVAMLASVNNDALAELVIGVTLLAVVIYVKAPAASKTRLTPTPFTLGLLVGIGLITKASTYFLAGLVPLAIIAKWWRDEEIGPTRERKVWLVYPLARALVVFLIPALILGGIWWVHNFNVYGFPDFLGLRAHDQVVADQPRTADAIAAEGLGTYLSSSLQTTFNSFWGQFGWMGLPMPGWIYTIFKILLLVAMGGLVLDRAVLRRSRSHAPPAGQRQAWILLWLAGLLAIAQYVYYNSEFLQLQGRYMFPGLIVFGLLLVLGVDAWRRWLLARWVWTRWATMGVFLLLAPLDVYVLWRFIVPLLSP